MSALSPEAELLKHRIEVNFQYERLFRSQIIAECIALENGVDRIIARYFCPDEAKHPLFFSLLFREAEVTYAAKISVLKKILKSVYPQFYETFKFVPSRLRKLGELRNKLAHCEIVVPDRVEQPEAVDGVTLRYYKDGQLISERITSDFVNRHVEEARDLYLAAVFLHIGIAQAEAGKLSDDFAKTIMELGEGIGKRVAERFAA